HRACAGAEDAAMQTSAAATEIEGERMVIGGSDASRLRVTAGSIAGILAMQVADDRAGLAIDP
ncbi:MAG TPA: hypothetical protein VF771_04445, partial [Longimicrobiaceae bacterium]